MKKRMDENTEQKIQFGETETETGKKPVWREKLHQMLVRFNNHYLFSVMIGSFLLDYCMEVACRKSLWKPFPYMFRNPIMFIFNVAILFLILGVGAFFRHRVLYASVATGILMGLAIADGILLCFRTTPFAAIDFTLIKNCMTIIDLYLNWFHLILIGVAIVAVLGVCIFFGLRLPKYTGKMYRIPVLLIAAASVFCLSGMDRFLIKIGVSSRNYSNLAQAYQSYGFVYCFAESIFNLGMAKPENYSAEAVDAIIEEKVNEALQEERTDHPNTGIPDMTDTTHSGDQCDVIDHEHIILEGNANIIFVQLESFFDVGRVNGLELSADPIPNFHALKETCSSGFLFVPSVGAGTANTEFEVITGMNMDFFGPGEYPYKTILKSTTCESAAYDLSDLGYATHAIHNNDGTFYDRHIVFSQLGFDTFTPMEYMGEYERNVNGFLKDSILTGEILDTLKSTEERDYIYTISVQAHGEYPSERLGEPQPIFLRYRNQSKENAWSYYINQLNEVDQFIGELVDALNGFHEPTVLVLFGDHLPGLGLENEDITNGRLTATEYVIWSNFEMSVTHRDVEAYQLTSHVLGKLGISYGILNKFHQNSVNDDAYLDQLELLQYDMLYGEREVYGGKNPYIASDLQMGPDGRQVSISGVSVEEDGTIYVHGRNFNSYSVIRCNGENQSTEYIDANTLKLSGMVPKAGDTITVAQIGEDKVTLGICEAYVY